MNDPKSQHSEDDFANASREEILAALFANMVIQQTNMAMMLLGKVAHPETGKIVQDIEAAKMFIDQLQMLEAKTKGNLSKQEDGLLKQALAALQMAFVEAVDSGGAEAKEAKPEKGAERTAAPKPESVPEPPVAKADEKTVEPSADAAAADDSRKRFTKKY